MADFEILFNSITNKLSSENENVEAGKMMSSPGITYKGKVFSFYYNDKMVFRLGREFDIEKTGVSEFELLNPFKNKPPMKDWFVVSGMYQSKWEMLALQALNKMQIKLDASK
ncbi:MAG: hypothetical protein D8M58_07625 [Calditrichaeota bacterium]|nr:MAG: hypothetical protein DWQ03_18865 [Calditrichota bacterium]MBL1205250.1 hypothetical protein [Calditrichota bacterium]NOG45079.1 hypothetical protein [Calditrichota bacterium]